MANITVDIQAKVVGYEQSIKALQAALAKVDPGSEMGKSITKAMEQAQSQVKALSKNMFPKASSDSQIDAIIEKTNRAGEAIQHVASLLQSVQISDLNLGAFGGDIETFKNQIASLQTELDSKLSAGIIKAVGESEQLRNVFQSLGTDLSKATGATLLEDLSKGAQKAASDVTELEKKLEKTQTSISNYQAIDNVLKSSRLGTLEGRTALDDELKTITGNYNAIFEQLRATMISGFSKLKTDTKLDTDGLLKTFFSDLTPENVQNHIQNLFSTLSSQGVFGENEKRKFYEAIFGGNNEYNTNNINLLTKSIGLDKAYEQYKVQLQEFYQKIVNDIDGKDQAQINRLISEDQLGKAVSATTKALDSAYSKIYNNIKQNQEKLNNALSDKDNIVLQLNTARQTQDTFSSAEQSLRQEIEAVRQENKNLENQIAQLREQLNQKLSNEAGNIRNIGISENRNAGQGLRESLEISEAYKNQLAQVAAKEQALGKLQGVVQRWFSIYAAIRMVRQAINSVISTIKELDKTITEIAIVTSMDQSELWDQMPKYTQLARNYAASISGVYQVSQLYYQQGLQTADVMALTEQTLKMARISGLDYAQATDYMTNAVRSFKMEMTDAQRVVDVYSAIAASSATSVTELASAMSKTASSAQAVGSSFENTTAMMAVMIEATRESAENIGSAMKSIISRYGEMTSDPSKLVDSEGQEMSLNRVDKALQTVGISIHNAVGEFRNFDEVIMELAQKWDTIDTNTQRYIATIMAGNRQQSRFLALVSSYDRLKELSAEAAESEDASQLQFLKTLDSVEAKTQQFQTSVQALYVNSGLEDFYKGILDWVNKVITSLDQLSDRFGLLASVGKISTTFTTLATLVTNLFTVIKVSYSRTRAQITAEAELDAARRAAIAQGESIEETNTYIQTSQSAINAQHEITKAAETESQKRIRIAQNEVKKTQTPLLGSKTMKLKTAGMGASVLGLAATTIGASMDINTQRQEKALISGIGSAFSGIGTGLMIGGGLGAAVGALTAIPGIIEAIGMATESTEEKVKKLSDAITTTNNAQLQSKNELKTLTDYKEKYEELKVAQYESADAKQEFINLQNEIAATYPTLIQSMTSEGNMVVDMTTAYEQLANAKRMAYKSDFISNIQAQLDAYGDLDYLIENIYGQKIFNNEENIIQKIGNLIPGVDRGSHLNTLTQAAVSKDVDSVMNNMNYETAEKLYGRNNMSSLPSINHGAGTGAVGLFYGKELKEEGKQIASSIFSEFYELSQQGLSLGAAQLELRSREGFAKYVELINNFDKDVYSYFLASSDAVRFQQTIMDRTFSTSNKQWAGILEQSANLGLGEFQSVIIGSQLDSLWETFQKDVASGKETRFKKVGESFTDSKGVTRDKTISDLYSDFLSLYDIAWYKNIFDQTKYLANDSIDALYENRGKYNKTNLQKQKGFELLGAEQEKFLTEYDEAAAEVKTSYEDYIKSIFFDNSELLNQLLSFSGENGFGYDFLSSMTSQIKTVQKNSDLSLAQQTEIIGDLANAWQAILAIEDPDIQAQVLSQFNSADLTSLTGIAKFINNISDIDGFDLKTINLDTYLQDLKNHINVNISGEIESYFSTIESEVDSFSKAISSATSGMDLKTAREMAAKLGTDLNDENFKIINGKFYYEDLEAIKKAYLPENEQLKTQAINNLTNQYSQLEEYDSILWNAINNNLWSTQDLQDQLNLSHYADIDEKTSFTAESLIESYSNYQEALASGATKAGVTFLEYLTNLVNDEYNLAGKATLNYISQNAAITSIKAGDIHGFIQTSGLMEEAIAATQQEIPTQYIEERAQVLADEAAIWNQQLNDELLSQAKSEDPKDYMKEAENYFIQNHALSESSLNLMAEEQLKQNQAQLEAIIQEEENRDFNAEAESKWIANGGTSLEDIQNEAIRLQQRNFTESESLALEDYYSRFNDDVEAAEQAFIQDRISQLYTSRAEQLAQIRSDLVKESNNRIQAAEDRATLEAATDEISQSWEAIYDKNMVYERAKKLAEEAKDFNLSALNLAEWKSEDPQHYMDQAIIEVQQEQEALVKEQAQQWAKEQINLAKEGNFSEITSDTVKKNAALIYDTYHEINTSIANSMVSAISDNKGLIKVTETNKEALDEIMAEHADWLSGDTTVGSYITISAQNLLDNVQAFEQFIVSSFDTDSERIKALTDAHKNQYANSKVENYNKVAAQESFAYEDLLNYISKAKGFDFLDDQSIEDEMSELGLAFDSVGNVIIENYDLWIAELESEIHALSASDANKQELNHAKALLEQTKHQQESNIEKSFTDILKDFSNITPEAVESLANALGMTYDEVVNYLIDNKNGTYRIDTNKLSQLLQKLDGKVSQATIDSIEKSVSSIGDTYLSNIKNASSYTTKGASSLADVEAFRQSYADIVGEALNENAFTYNSLAQSFMPDSAAIRKYIDAQKKLLLGMGYTEEFVNAYITDQTDKAIRAGIELDGFLNANTNKQRNDEANKLIQQIRGLSNYKNLFDIGTLYARFGQGEWTEQIADQYDLLILKTLESGNKAAVDLLKQIEPDTSQEELEAVFNSQINKLNDVMSQVGDLVAGQFVGTEGKLYQILRSAGAVNDDGVVEAGFNMVKVYAAIYNEMLTTEGHTTSDLNKIYAQMITSYANSQNDIKDILSSGITGMSADSFGTIMDHYGLDMKNVLENATGLVIDAFGNIIVHDFKAFETWMNSQIPENQKWDSSDPAFKQIYSSYVDSKVELLNQPLTDAQKAAEQLNAILSAEDKQSFNVSYLNLEKTNQETLQTILSKYSAVYTDGILTISDKMAVPALVSELGSLAAKSAKLIPEQLAELEDAIAEVLNNIVSLLSNGINGTLNNKDATTIRNWYKTYTDQYTNLDKTLDFIETAEGLKLTETSLANIYDLMKHIDGIKAEALLDDIIKSRESFQSLTGALREFNDAMRLDGVDEGTNKLKGLNSALSNTAKMMQDVVQKAMTSPDSMNFMSNKLPDDMQTAVNAWENASKAIKTITAAEKSGYMGVQDFYNIVNTASSLMEAAGKNFEVAGMDAATLLQKGAENVKVVDGKLTVDISSAGLDIVGSADQLKQNMATGINELADAEIAIIDAEIQVLEILAAMEQMGDMDVDVDNDGLTFEINDIFNPETLSGFTEDVGGMKPYLDKLKEVVDGSDEAIKAFQQFKINGTSLYELLTANAETWKKVFGSEENVSKFMQKFTKGIEGWDLEGNLQSQVLEFMKGLGQDYSIDLGDAGIFHVNASGVSYVIDFSDEKRMQAAKEAAESLKLNFGKTDQEFKDYLKNLLDQNDTTDGQRSELSIDQNYVLKVATGQIEVVKDETTGEEQYKVGGKLYKNKSVANAVAELIQAGAKADWERLQQRKYDLGPTEVITGTMSVGKAEIEVTSDGKGNVTYQTSDGKYKGNSLDELYTEWFNGENEKEGLTREKNGLDFKEWQVRKGISIEPIFEINEKEGNAKTNEKLRKSIQDAIDNGIIDEVKENGHAYEVTLPGDVNLTIPKEKINIKDGQSPEEAVQEYLRDNYNTIDLDLKDTISSAIEEGLSSALSTISSEVNSFDSDKITAAASALQQLASALSTLAGIAYDSIKNGLAGLEIPDFTTEDGKNPSIPSIQVDTQQLQVSLTADGNVDLVSPTEVKLSDTLNEVEGDANNIGITSASNAYQANGFEITDPNLGTINGTLIKAILSNLGITAVNNLDPDANMQIDQDLGTIAAQVSAQLETLGITGAQNINWTLFALGSLVGGKQLSIPFASAIVDQLSILNTTGQFPESGTLTVENITTADGQVGTLTITKVTDKKLSDTTGYHTSGEVTATTDTAKVDVGEATISTESYQIEWKTINPETGEITVSTITIPADLDFNGYSSLEEYLKSKPNKVTVETQVNNTVQTQLNKEAYKVTIIPEIKGKPEWDGGHPPSGTYTAEELNLANEGLKNWYNTWKENPEGLGITKEEFNQQFRYEQARLNVEKAKLDGRKRTEELKNQMSSTEVDFNANAKVNNVDISDESDISIEDLVEGEDKIQVTGEIIGVVQDAPSEIEGIMHITSIEGTEDGDIVNNFLDNLSKKGWNAEGLLSSLPDSPDDLAQLQTALNNVFQGADLTLPIDWDSDAQDLLPDIQINEFLDGLKTQVEESGKDTIQGLANGLGETGPLQAAGNKVGTDTIHFIDTALGVASPSKLTKQSGEFVVEGLINGMAEQQGPLSTKAQEIGQAVINGIIAGIEENLSNLTDKIEEVIEALTEEGIKKQFEEVGESWGQTIVDALLAEFTSLPVDIAGKFAEQVDGLKESTKSVGETIVEGITEGMNGFLEIIKQITPLLAVIAAGILAIGASALALIPLNNTLGEIYDKLIEIKANSDITINITANDGATSILDQVLAKLKELQEKANQDISGEGGNNGKGNNQPSQNNPPSQNPQEPNGQPVPEKSIRGINIPVTPRGGPAGLPSEEVTVKVTKADTSAVDNGNTVINDATANVSDAEVDMKGNAPTIEANIEANGDIDTGSNTPTITAEVQTDGTEIPAIETVQNITPQGAIESIPEIETEQNIESSGGVSDIADFTTIQTIITKGGVGGGTGSTGSGGGNPHVTLMTRAKGNVGFAMASGTQTLMGELGPELVVSNGQYFIVGRGGAEMVDLAPDSIVFNHLQTEKILKHGSISGRGRAVTNEHNAVSFATGNVGGGLAMASASAALAQLKALRAMWESLKGASVQDLAGAGGGGGGGGGGDKAKIVDPRAWIDTVERWYNLMQEIAKLEQQITYQEQIRTKLQSDWQASGKAYFNSQKKSLNALNAEVAAQEQLNISRQMYFNKRVDALKESPLGKLYTWDEESGTMKFRDDVNINGKQGAMAFLTDLVGFDDIKGANYTNEEKYNILQANGFASYMKYDSNGMEIKMDEDNDGEITDEERESFYEKATQAWWDKVNEFKEATESLHQAIEDGNVKIEELQTAINEELKAIRENQMEVEDAVLNAIEEARQREIDALQDQRDALEESVGKYIDGLSDALDKEREMYEDEEAQDELNRNRRRLAILQRSGGSATDISALQDEIRTQERDLYFDAQQKQIDAIQEASDKEIERLDNQIDIMTEQLEYQKQYGLLWNDVYSVMDGSVEQIVAFISGETAAFWGKSPLANADEVNKTIFQAEYWKSYADSVTEDMNLLAEISRKQQEQKDYDTFNQQMIAEVGAGYDASGKYKQMFLDEYTNNGRNLSEATKVVSNQYYADVERAKEEKRREEERKRQEEAKKAAAAPSGGWDDGGSSSDSGGGSSRKKTKVIETTRDCTSCTGRCQTQCQGSCSGSCTGCTGGCSGSCGGGCSSSCSGACKGGCLGSSSFASGKHSGDITGHGATGGYVHHGVYELGEKGLETVLNAQQTQILRNNILSNRPSSLISLLKTYNEGFSRMDTPLTGEVSTDNSITIENMNMTMDVKQISNDYDARRAGEQAMNEMLRIARKTSAANSVRR